MTNIQDVAKRAGVSVSTVSRVLNGTARVNSNVRTRVEVAIQELQYRPSRAARSLRTNYSSIIGLLISDIQNPFFMDLIQGIEDTALQHGYSLILCNSTENVQREQRYIEVLRDERVAGVIIVPTSENQPHLAWFREHHIPIVAVDRRINDRHVDAVFVDNVFGAHEAVSHLIANGYRRIGAITGPSTITTGRDRLLGYRQALQDANITLDPLLERCGSFKVDSGRFLATELLASDPPIDALFVGNNLMTMGALEAIQAHNLRVPNDIALVGYDEMPWAALGSISLTTVMQPVYELGSTAARQLFHRLQHPDLQTRQEIILTPTLCVRGSSVAQKGSSPSNPTTNSAPDQSPLP
jgi:DNA-binding LacI/PurR family transcriptional regulator